MLKKIVAIVRNNWVFIAIALLVITISIFLHRGNDYEMSGCSTCSAGDAGVLVDTELSGCSTCSLGDAGVFPDSETAETEIYNMPDDYYNSPMEVADTIAEVAHNPDVFEAVTEDRENEVVVDPTDYAAQTDEQLVADFYGDQENDEIEDDAEIDYAERERIKHIRFMPLDMDMADGSFTLL